MEAGYERDATPRAAAGGKNGVRLSPRLPASWDAFTLRCQIGRSRCLLTAARDVPYITLDGEKQVGAYVEIRDDGQEHEIRFPVS